MDRQKPLGELLTIARAKRKMTRADVCKHVKISENSLVRYEKAGVDKSGQHPPATKLSSLCFLLEISPFEALISCLNPKEYKKFINTLYVEPVTQHPLFRNLFAKYNHILHEHALMKTALYQILGKEEFSAEEKSDISWVLYELKKTLQHSDELFPIPKPNILKNKQNVNDLLDRLPPASSLELELDFDKEVYTTPYFGDPDFSAGQFSPISDLHEIEDFVEKNFDTSKDNPKTKKEKRAR